MGRIKWKRYRKKMTFENMLLYILKNKSEWGTGSETKELTAFQMNTYPHLKKERTKDLSNL